MDNMEKVEKLREKADVSYEEARKALEENNWDLLDAIVSLEKQGKTKAPGQTAYSTSYEEQNDYVSVKETIKEEKEKKERGTGIKDLLKRFLNICKDNSFCVIHKDEQICQIPLIGFLVLLFFFWEVMVPVMVVALFFQFRYRLVGKDDLKEVNGFMESAENLAEQLKEGVKDAKENAEAEEVRVDTETVEPSTEDPEKDAEE